jgi:hypothetical protein
VVKVNIGLDTAVEYFLTQIQPLQVVIVTLSIHQPVLVMVVQVVHLQQAVLEVVT